MCAYVCKCVRMCDCVWVNENAARLLTFLWQHELELDCEISSSFPSWCIAEKNTWERRGRYDSLFNPTLSLTEKQRKERRRYKKDIGRVTEKCHELHVRRGKEKTRQACWNERKVEYLIFSWILCVFKEIIGNEEELYIFAASLLSPRAFFNPSHATDSFADAGLSPLKSTFETPLDLFPDNKQTLVKYTSKTAWQTQWRSVDTDM